MAYDDAPQVLATKPRNKEIDVSTVIENIQITFTTDIDQDHLDGNFQLQDGSGTLLPVTVTYQNRVAILTVDGNLQPSTTYRISVTGGTGGVRNIFGIVMAGMHMASFTTAAGTALVAPTIVAPVNRTIIRSKPEITWQAVTNATHYEIEISRFNTMRPLLWSTGNNPIYTTNPVTPGEDMPDGPYYWRMRAFKANGEAGRWTEVLNFTIDTVVEGPIAPEDTLPPNIGGFLYDAYDEPEAIATYPSEDGSNVALTTKTIYFHIQGTIDPDDVRMEMFGTSVTGEDTIADHGLVEGILQVLPQPDGSTVIAFTPEVVSTTPTEDLDGGTF